MRRLVAALGVALLALTGCSTPDTEPTPDPAEPTESAESGDMNWQPDSLSLQARVVVGATWTAIADETSVRFEGPTDDVVVDDDRGGSVGSVFIDGDQAVVSYGFGGEAMRGLAYRVDLTTGDQTEIRSPQPANGGSWALHDDALYYPTLGERGAYCLATLAVRDGNGEDGWCAPPRTGFSSVSANEYGVGLMTFDDTRPVACRTVMLLGPTGTPEPTGRDNCKGWDVAATSTGAIWSEVPRERRQEEARFRAIADGETRNLGRGTTGTLVPCGGDTFFVRDPRGDDDPARLMRWDGSELTVAFESESTGNVFLAPPECADAIVTVTEYGESGDRRVWAPVP